MTTGRASAGLAAGIVTIGLANVANAANGMDEAAVLTPASESGRFGSATTNSLFLPSLKNSADHLRPSRAVASEAAAARQSACVSDDRS